MASQAQNLRIIVLLSEHLSKIIWLVLRYKILHTTAEYIRMCQLPSRAEKTQAAD